MKQVDIEKSLIEAADYYESLNEGVGSMIVGGILLSPIVLAATILVCADISYKNRERKKRGKMTDINEYGDIVSLSKKAKFCKYNKESFIVATRYMKEIKPYIDEYMAQTNKFKECDKSNISINEYKKYYSYMNEKLKEYESNIDKIENKVLPIIKKYKVLIKSCGSQYGTDLNEFKSLVKEYIDSIPDDLYIYCYGDDSATSWYDELDLNDELDKLDDQTRYLLDKEEFGFVDRTNAMARRHENFKDLVFSILPDAKFQITGKKLKED